MSAPSDQRARAGRTHPVAAVRVGGGEPEDGVAAGARREVRAARDGQARPVPGGGGGGERRGAGGREDEGRGPARDEELDAVREGPARLGLASFKIY